MAKETERPIERELRSPRAAAIAGILYSILTVAIMLLTFGLTRADPADVDSALLETCDMGREAGSPVSPDYGPRGNEFSGEVNWVQIDLGLDDHSHLITPEQRLSFAIARQ